MTSRQHNEAGADPWSHLNRLSTGDSGSWLHCRSPNRCWRVQLRHEMSQGGPHAAPFQQLIQSGRAAAVQHVLQLGRVLVDSFLAQQQQSVHAAVHLLCNLVFIIILDNYFTVGNFRFLRFCVLSPISPMLIFTWFLIECKKILASGEPLGRQMIINCHLHLIYMQSH